MLDLAKLVCMVRDIKDADIYYEYHVTLANKDTIEVRYVYTGFAQDIWVVHPLKVEDLLKSPFMTEVKPALEEEFAYLVHLVGKYKRGEVNVGIG